MCDICKQYQAMGKEMFGCRECCFDVCLSCMSFSEHIDFFKGINSFHSLKESAQKILFLQLCPKMNAKSLSLNQDSFTKIKELVYMNNEKQEEIALLKKQNEILRQQTEEEKSGMIVK